MTPREMQSAFEYELVNHDNKNMVESDTIYYWLNQSIIREVKIKFTGTDKGIGFEQNQKRTDDLRTLLKEVKLSVTVGVDGINKLNSYIAIIPSDYWFKINEEVSVRCPDLNGTTTTTKRVSITECTHDTYNKQIIDPYSEHVLHYEDAKPLRLFNGNTVELITDGNYVVSNYYLRYLKSPIIIGIDSDDCDLPEHMHHEIVTSAVRLYLESTKDDRYQTNVRENENNE